MVEGLICHFPWHLDALLLSVALEVNQAYAQRVPKHRSQLNVMFEELFPDADRLNLEEELFPDADRMDLEGMQRTLDEQRAHAEN